MATIQKFHSRAHTHTACAPSVEQHAAAIHSTAPLTACVAMNSEPLFRENSTRSILQHRSFCFSCWSTCIGRALVALEHYRCRRPPYADACERVLRDATSWFGRMSVPRVVSLLQLATLAKWLGQGVSPPKADSANER